MSRLSDKPEYVVHPITENFTDIADNQQMYTGIALPLLVIAIGWCMC